jgi:hypothetical protein
VKKDIAYRWADALESGRFLQAKGTLKKEYPSGTVFHCAEGVLCELYEQENEVISTKFRETEWNGEGWVKEGCTVYGYGPHYLTTRIPEVVAQWAGLIDGNGWEATGTHPVLYIKDDAFAPQAGEEYSEDMATLNDHGWKFTDLSTLIREQWRTL